MDSFWVDCITAKYIMLLPQVKEFLAFLNVWDFKIIIKDNKLEIESDTKNGFRDILEHGYNIKWLDYWNLDVAKECLVPVDLYYLPYSKNYYQQGHILHYVILKHKCGSKVRVLDENPAFNDFMPYNTLKDAYDASIQLSNLPVIKFDKTSCRELSISQEIQVFYDRMKTIDSGTDAFLKNLLYSKDLSQRSQFISELQLISKKYYAFTMAMESLYGYVKLEGLLDCANASIEYLKKWELVFNLNNKWVILKRDSDLKKLEALFVDVMSIQTEMDRIINKGKQYLQHYLRQVQNENAEI